MKFISWNIDSLNAALDAQSNRAQMTFSVLKNIASQKPDFVAIQETKLNQEKKLDAKKQAILDELFPEYGAFWNYSVEPAKKGYAGTLFLTKWEPTNVTYPKIGAPSTMDFEGRIITLEYPEFFVSQVYTPNAGSGLKRLEERVGWDAKYKEYLSSLNKQKPVIFSGDFNVAHNEIDLKNDATNHQSPGFTDEEREGFTNLLNVGFTDIWRKLNPEIEEYTWWAQRSKTSKINNTGWRIDYYLISEALEKKTKDVGMIDTGDRQDHTPIYIDINVKGTKPIANTSKSDEDIQIELI